MRGVLLGRCSILEFLLSFLVGKAYYNSRDFKTIENVFWFSEISEREA